MQTDVKEEIINQEPLKSSTPKRINWLGWVGGGLVLLFLILYPLLNQADTFAVKLLTETLIFGIFALSLNLLVGYTGLVSFGHATYWGVGAYTAGILSAQAKIPNFFLGLLLGVVVSGVVAALLGYLSVRTSGIYFLMLTLAFSQMFYAIAFKWTDFTGGSNGLPVLRPEYNLFGWIWNIEGSLGYYFVVFVIFLAVFFLLRQIILSPFGQSLIGIRDNENRMTALGYHTSTYKLIASVIAGILGGVAGVLNVYYNGFVSAGDFYWTTSGLVLVMVLLGGKGTLIGPVLGAFFIRYAEQFIQGSPFELGSFELADRWQLVLGLIFIVFILAAPNGLVGLGKQLYKLVKR
jgi:branched-chain amino acid transport system permease protein